MSLRSLLGSLSLATLLALPGLAIAQISVSVNIAPPPLPVYEQPPLPADGYLWTPGYWAWGEEDQDYYWVPGTWVEAPQPEYLWTPGYWAFDGGAYLWHTGYWGPHIGFYGGVDYGYGYSGEGYEGGYWRGGRMYYNRAVVNVGSTHIENVYEKAAMNRSRENRASFNGGNGGIRARPSAAQEEAERERHVPITSMQQRHIQAAQHDPEFHLKSNGGHPAVAATPRPGEFSGPGVVPTRGGAMRADPRAMSPQRPAMQPQARTPDRPPVNQEQAGVRERGQEARPPEPRRAEAPRPPAEVRPPEPRRAEAPRPPAEVRPPEPRRAEAPRPPAEVRPPEPRREQVEPRREPEHTSPRAEQRAPQPRPADHPQDHEHH